MPDRSPVVIETLLEKETVPSEPPLWNRRVTEKDPVTNLSVLTNSPNAEAEGGITEETQISDQISPFFGDLLLPAPFQSPRDISWPNNYNLPPTA